MTVLDPLGTTWRPADGSQPRGGRQKPLRSRRESRPRGRHQLEAEAPNFERWRSKRRHAPRTKMRWPLAGELMHRRVPRYPPHYWQSDLFRERQPSRATALIVGSSPQGETKVELVSGPRHEWIGAGLPFPWSFPWSWPTERKCRQDEAPKEVAGHRGECGEELSVPVVDPEHCRLPAMPE